MNYMKDVAKLLGVEIGEEFNLKILPNRYKLKNDGLYYYNEKFNEWFSTDKLIYILNGDDEIEKRILTDKEKDYLSLVIKPFRNKVQYICKNDDFIEIKYETKTKIHNLFLPIFEEYIKCKGMEDGKRYSLEELQL